MSLMFYERQSVRVKQRDMFATQRAIGAHQYSLTWWRQDNVVGLTYMCYYKNAT